MSETTRQSPETESLSALAHRMIHQFQRWGVLGIDCAAHDVGTPGETLQIGGRSYVRGLGHYAPGVLVFDLNGEYAVFSAQIGVQTREQRHGAVAFRVVVDGECRFESEAMRGGDKARSIKVDVRGAAELALCADAADDDGFGGIANWCDAELKPLARRASTAKFAHIDVAPFACLVSWDAEREHGCRATRIEEFDAADVFLATPLTPTPEGVVYVPVAETGARRCVGLQWLERRKLTKVAISFASNTALPDPKQCVLQAWLGESAWQGSWHAVPGPLHVEGPRWALPIDWRSFPAARDGIQKLRWVFPPSIAPLAVESLEAYTLPRWAPVELRVELDAHVNPSGGVVQPYNGEWDDGGRAPRTLSAQRPAVLRVRAHMAYAWKSDRTVLHFDLPSGRAGVAVDDVLSRGRVYVPELGLFVTPGGASGSLVREKEVCAGRMTILDRVRKVDDQSLEQALARTRNPIQDSGPMLLSLPCHAFKVVLERDGALRAGDFALRPWYGVSADAVRRRRLVDGWLPLVENIVEDGARQIRQLSYVAPDNFGRPLAVVEVEVRNTGLSPTRAEAQLALRADASRPLVLRQDGGTAAALCETTLAARAEWTPHDCWRVDAASGMLALDAVLPPGGVASCAVYHPSWAMSADALLSWNSREELRANTAARWREALAGAMQVSIPEPLLENIIRASQVHCLIAARPDDDGATIAAWIASMAYGPLESEAHSVIRGMDFFGHHEFARRSLDFFVRRYSPQGYLTTGYTLMGTGWHLWTLGEHVALAGDEEWLHPRAAEVVRVGRWIAAQRAKTGHPELTGPLSEAGLMPPGVMADWNAFAYYFCLNGYYHAGLAHAAEALARVGCEEAEALRQEAAALRAAIRRAYRQTQSRMPVLPLRNGSWTPGHPSQVHCPGPTNDYFPNQDANRSWCYDVELGAHQLVPSGVIAPDEPDAERMLHWMEDGPFLADGWFDYPAARNERDWFNLGGFSKVQPYYCRAAEIYAMRGEPRPFLRVYFNSLAALLNLEVLSLWEHFHAVGAWNKTHETGYFLHQTRQMLVMERGGELWLLPLAPARWLGDGCCVEVRQAPTRFGPAGYRIVSALHAGTIEAEIDPPTRARPERIVLRLRHPRGAAIRSVQLNGRPHEDFDPAAETVHLPADRGRLALQVAY